MKIAPYARYRSSTLQWTGEIPDHWDVRRNGALFEQRNEAGGDGLPVLMVSLHHGVTEGDDEDESARSRKIMEDRTAYKLVRRNDLAYNMMRAWQGAIGAAPVDGLVSPAYVVAKPKAGLVTRYFEALFRTVGYTKDFERYSYGIASFRWRLYWESFKAMNSIVPPPDEQRAIVRFLDRETAKIDAVIAKHERLIELLQEKRQALITRAVTKGLDPSVPMKDSGVEWLGEVPAHWVVDKLGRRARIGNGCTPSRENQAYWDSGTFPWLNSAVVNEAYVREASDFVTDLALRECHLPRVPAGSVVVALTGQGKTRGMCAVTEIGEATVNQHLAFVVCGKALRAEYLRWFLHAQYPALRFISDGEGSTKGALTCDDLARFRVLIPPLEEQDIIIARIGEKLHRLDLLHESAIISIEMMRERRSALISAAVTGKIDVREAV